MTANRTLRPEAQIAAAVRASIAAARKAGTLDLPADATVSVRAEHASMCSGVNINITADDRWARQYGQHSPAAHDVGDRIANMFRDHRAAADAGYVWGEVLVNGSCVESVPDHNWRPGEN